MVKWEWLVADLTGKKRLRQSEMVCVIITILIILNVPGALHFTEVWVAGGYFEPKEQ